MVFTYLVFYPIFVSSITTKQLISMGTRSTVKFYSEYSKKPVLSVYQQFDGYISGVGFNLANFLKEKTIINGISGQTMENGFANGMGCLAAQYVKQSKTEIGGFYLTTNDDDQEYNYKVKMKNGQFEITVNDLFKGTPQELLDYKEPEEEE
jgi:hypothetical protein